MWRDHRANPFAISRVLYLPLYQVKKTHVGKIIINKKIEQYRKFCSFFFEAQDDADSSASGIVIGNKLIS